MWQETVAADRPIATDPSQLIPQCASKFQHQIRVGEWPAMLNYLKKFAMDILPSVVATVIGAYVVNHYIVTKPGAGASVSAAVSTADPKEAKAENKAASKPAPDARPAETSADVSNIPAAGVKAKGISEKAILEKAAAEKPAMAEKPQEKSAEKSVDTKPADAPVATASIPAEPRRRQLAPREKAVAKVVPVPVQPAAPAVASVPNPAPAVEAAVAPEERRDANDLARAAIERLRGTNDAAPRPQEVARVPDASRSVERNVDSARLPEAPRVVSAPVVQPLPPPVMVSTPPSEAFDQGSQPKPSYEATAGLNDPRRPTPPADIPISRPPLDLRAGAYEPPVQEEHKSVAEGMLLAAKSVFQAVIPK
jgi:hypothetical protein